MTEPITSCMQAHRLYQRRARGRAFKRVSACLELRQDGDGFVVTSRGGSTPIMSIGRDDVGTLHFEQARGYLGRISVVSHLWRYFRVHVYHKTDRRSSVRWWYKDHAGATRPLVDDMRIHLPSGTPLDPPALVQRRRVRRDVAKPIRDQIAAWEKLARSYLTLSDNFTRGMLSEVKSKLPDLEEEPTMDGLLKMIRYGAERGYGCDLYSASSYSWVRDKEDLRRHAKSAFKNAFERWKEELYHKHGVFTWVDKAA